MGAVTIRDVRKHYGSVEVLHGVSIDIADGEFVILVGPSGCGKSTLLRMIAGLEDITGGEIEIGGQVVNDLAPKDRDIAMVFQSYALYPHMTVEENMGFSLKLARVNKETIRARVANAAEVLGLQPYLERYPRHLSGGQRQRVAMGRAIVRSPQVFLFDEPLSNLDAKLRVQMRGEIKMNHRRLSTTTVYVTHDQIEAMTMADRIVVMRSGYVEQIGSPLDLYDTPANLFVAGFIGSPAMNILDGSIAGTTFTTPDGIDIPLKADAIPAHHGPVKLGIRPEHLRLDPKGLNAEVMVVEPTGSETQVAFRLGDQELVGIFRERIATSPGNMMGISIASDQVHLFDPETGKRLTR
ncbi:sn-glycerol-3-phosphate ABC transporter ATP-binding protein UgpC [Devosia sp. XJ19-1]|uniref:Sn-glycerol-3-phosphate ABC transporter ATP-binding protein UgpC n=1 Tax=Devosia ureilytica TaxID=2952754 RepID=A0A9Q4ASS2_9HYPH|nr:sn-glycerol-3-phosphate ABC transporter ATP-binding protein UgpC [Devosia ureilytica]MCP8885196.1 sn-glycerol-3-phosphate ABC transporter ATP-binding protein UgpC [Devosia ureilytica]MCP8888918.1 sn-glycerol-3-phosphate ABC transporter ATP-binding protein UgpC [Devosia ureilytica]